MMDISRSKSGMLAEIRRYKKLPDAGQPHGVFFGRDPDFPAELSISRGE